MKTVIGFLLLINFFLTGELYSQTKKLKTFKNITPTELKQISESDPTAVILDVRTKKEYRKGHISNSFNAGNSKALTKITDTLDLDQPLLVYCDEGTRSFTACIILKEKGFLNVFNLETGLIGWKESGFNLIKRKLSD